MLSAVQPPFIDQIVQDWRFWVFFITFVGKVSIDWSTLVWLRKLVLRTVDRVDVHEKRLDKRDTVCEMRHGDDGK